MNTKKKLFSAKELAIHGHSLAKTDFFYAGGPASPDMLPQYSCKHVSVGLSHTPAVVNHKVHNKYQTKHCFWHKIDDFLGENWFFFVLAALQPPICCCNTTANTFQRVCPRPRQSSITNCIMNTKKTLFLEKKMAIHGQFWAKTDFFLC